jgi:putative CRISPR-associated protein (TIGR02619 family)
MNLIISTCGTSVLTNLADESTRKLVNQYANEHDLSTIPSEHQQALKDLIQKAKEKLLQSDIKTAKRASAELNGILSISKDQTPLDQKDVYVLIHTDTQLGTDAAKLIQAKLESYGVIPQLEPAESLTTRSRQSFDKGLRHLVDWAARTLPGYRANKYHIIFNLVGGFKSVQGFMQTLGMFYADEIVYIFESGSELLRIPRLPVDLNSAAQEIMRAHARLFRRLAVLGPQPDEENLHNIPESMLERVDDLVDLSPWGKLIWEAFRPELYSQRLLDSPSDRIRFETSFEKDVRNLPKDRYAILNERIDDLMMCLENQVHLDRLDIKPLKNKDVFWPSTHEADAWADADCRRIFFHYESGVAELDRLIPALH